MKKEELLCYIWLSLRCGAGSEEASRLLDVFDGAAGVYAAKREELAAVCDNDATVDSLCDKNMSMPKKILDFCIKNDVGILTCDSEYYPSRLRSIYAKPIVLYCKGKMRDLDKNVLIACVGTRNCTEYGRTMAYKMGAELAMGGAFVVSGMALGIDAISQRGALSERGYTIAVLGSGIDVIYPPQNKSLYREIAEKGLIITEFAPGTRPYAKNFPIRNRIISGLSNGTVVIEAGKASGALITAEKAIEQGKQVFAVPGDVGSDTSDGANELIMQGSKLVTCAKDVLCEYELLYPHKIFTEHIKTIHFVKKSGVNVTYIPEEDESEPQEEKKHGLLSLLRGRKKKSPENEDAVLSASEFEELSGKRGTGYAAAAKEETEASAPQEHGGEKPTEPPAEIPDDLGETEKNILRCMKSAMTADEITAQYRKKFDADASEAELLSTLTMLEIDGFLESCAGGKYRRT